MFNPKPIQRKSKRPARPRADKLPLKFRIQNYYELMLSRADLSRLIERRAPELDTDEAYALILEAFDRATIWLGYVTETRYGPTQAERRLLVKQIAQLSQKLLTALTGELNFQRLDPGAMQYDLFARTGRLQSVTDALPVLGALHQAASEILELDSRTFGDADSISAKQRNQIELDILFSGLMLAWQKLTGKKPDLTIDHDGYVTCPFSLFFYGYFGNRFSDRAILERCKKLPISVDASMDEETVVSLHKRWGVKD